jgi:hypothetical protein
MGMLMEENMIQINVDKLQQMNWEEIARPVRMETNDDGEVVRYVNMMISEKTGEIFRVDYGIYVYDDMAVSLVVLKETDTPYHFKIELVDNADGLTGTVRDVVLASIAKYNGS